MTKGIFILNKLDFLICISYSILREKSQNSFNFFDKRFKVIKILNLFVNKIDRLKIERYFFSILIIRQALFWIRKG